MATTWTTLTADKDTDGSIRNWINHADIPVERVISQAETLILQRLRVIDMVKLATGTVLTGATELDVSALDMLSVKAFFWYGDNAMKLTLRQYEMFEITLAFDESNPPQLEVGTPTDFTHNRDTIYFNQKCIEDHHYRSWYYQRPPVLSALNDTNLLAEKYEHLLIAACMFWGYKFRKDERRAKENLTEVMGYIDMAHVESDMAFETAEYNPYWNQS